LQLFKRFGRAGASCFGTTVVPLLQSLGHIEKPGDGDSMFL